MLARLKCINQTDVSPRRHLDVRHAILASVAPVQRRDWGPSAAGSPDDPHPPSLLSLFWTASLRNTNWTACTP